MARRGQRVRACARAEQGRFTRGVCTMQARLSNLLPSFSLDQKLALVRDVRGHWLAGPIEARSPAGVAQARLARLREAGVGLAHRAERLQLSIREHPQLDTRDAFDALLLGGFWVHADRRVGL